ncbi:ring-infected erythrocyte surface antigen domain-containing protein [Wolbachia pipientis]|nr:hypothetical protein [Wolbachia pipientis]
MSNDSFDGNLLGTSKYFKEYTFNDKTALKGGQQITLGEIQSSTGIVEASKIIKFIENAEVKKNKVLIANPVKSKSLLHYAVNCEGNIDVVKNAIHCVLRSGVDINHEDENNVTPLVYFIRSFDHKRNSSKDFAAFQAVVKLLSIHGASLDKNLIQDVMKNQFHKFIKDPKSEAENFYNSCEHAREELKNNAKNQLDVSDVKNISIHGSCIEIVLDDHAKEIKVSEFLRNEFYRNNGITEFSMLHSGKDKIDGFRSADGTRHYTYAVREGSYEKHLIWYVKGKKCEATLNIDSDGFKLVDFKADQKLKEYSQDELLSANKEVIINGLSLSEIIRENNLEQEMHSNEVIRQSGLYKEKSYNEIANNPSNEVIRQGGLRKEKSHNKIANHPFLHDSKSFKSDNESRDSGAAKIAGFPKRRRSTIREKRKKNNSGQYNPDILKEKEQEFEYKKKVKEYKIPASTEKKLDSVHDTSNKISQNTSLNMHSELKESVGSQAINASVLDDRAWESDINNQENNIKFVDTKENKAEHTTGKFLHNPGEFSPEINNPKSTDANAEQTPEDLLQKDKLEKGMEGLEDTSTEGNLDSVHDTSNKIFQNTSLNVHSELKESLESKAINAPVIDDRAWESDINNQENNIKFVDTKENKVGHTAGKFLHNPGEFSTEINNPESADTNAAQILEDFLQDAVSKLIEELSQPQKTSIRENKEYQDSGEFPTEINNPKSADANAVQILEDFLQDAVSKLIEELSQPHKTSIREDKEYQTKGVNVKGQETQEEQQDYEARRNGLAKWKEHRLQVSVAPITKGVNIKGQETQEEQQVEEYNISSMSEKNVKDVKPQVVDLTQAQRKKLKTISFDDINNEQTKKRLTMDELCDENGSHSTWKKRIEGKDQQLTVKTRERG